MSPTDPLFLLALQVRSTCPCKVTAEEKNRIIAYLAPLGGTVAGFPVRLVAVGAAWEIRPA
jgi:hypothetical protein